MDIGDRIIIKYNGDTVNFGQLYDGMTGNIDGYFGNRYKIILDKKSREKIDEFNYRIGTDWTTRPSIPFQYVYTYNKSLEIE